MNERPAFETWLTEVLRVGCFGATTGNRYLNGRLDG